MVFILGLLRSTFDVLTPYVMSNFNKHALSATTNIIANIVSGIIKLPYAKLLDCWGRPQGFTLIVLFTTLGTILMATCQNVAMYCAAQVFFYVGYYGIQFSLVLFIADSSPGKNRALMFGIIWSPSLISIWASGPLATSILKSLTFEWGFGICCIVILVVCAPVIALLFKFHGTESKSNAAQQPETERRLRSTITYYLREFDVIGLLILSTGLSLLILPLSIYSYQPDGWRSALVICFFLFGGLLVIAFALYEAYLAPSSFLPWTLMKHPTVLWTNIMAASLYTSEFISSAYIYSMLIVVFDQTTTQAAYIKNIYYIGSSFWTLVLGLALRYHGRIKIWTLVLGIPFFILGQGMMIAFKPSFTPLSLMIVCKILIAFGGGTMYPIEQMTLMAVSQKHTAALLAVESVVVDIGKSAGSAIATAIWTAMFRQKLSVYLPIDEQDMVDKIYGSLDVQASYRPGSVARDAINHAYLDTQHLIFIVATALLAVTWISVTFWEDIDVTAEDEHEETEEDVQHRNEV
ncbi:MFS general substrate transporter [Aaosphaeria arxii CBS 175.79]|uniref:MFS general substrate transporter n=1 Tax=Aaosphaeria arxii CBS 175.79 TaxID=1450172 RepID=A0A6A5Y5V8_9PLEO|nr:MFS general substrate transporter [Aaosphaeria arxii CBS 175.79]KAF2020888.1 MFS general substrate transporter [Aaosphaeria arxii CBS 175.79]